MIMHSHRSAPECVLLIARVHRLVSLFALQLEIDFLERTVPTYKSVVV